VSNNKKGNLTLRLWKITPGIETEGFEKMAEESMYYSGGKKAIRVSIDSKEPYFRDVLKKIYLSKSGKYRLSVCFKERNGKYEQKDVEFNIVQ